jgi:hypothetical protein
MVSVYLSANWFSICFLNILLDLLVGEFHLLAFLGGRVCNVHSWIGAC